MTYPNPNNPYARPERNQYLALLDAEKKDIERMSLQHLASLVVKALFIGLCLVPFLMPWGN